MSDQSITLKQVLMPGDADLPDGTWALIASSVAVTGLQALVAAQCGPEGWVGALRSMREACSEIFNLTVSDLLAGAWAKHREIAAALKESKEKPEETMLVPLAHHSLESVHHPYIEIALNGASHRVTFDITATVDVDAALLKLKAGRICAIDSGSCQGSMKVLLANVLIVERATKKLSLAGSVTV
jgi:hypothetical protein